MRVECEVQLLEEVKTECFDFRLKSSSFGDPIKRQTEVVYSCLLDIDLDEVNL
jgi:hypothetical protein